MEDLKAPAVPEVVPPVAPESPAQAPAPAPQAPAEDQVTTTTTTVVELSDDEKEDKEWDEAIEHLHPELKKEGEDGADKQAEAAQTTTTTTVVEEVKGDSAGDGEALPKGDSESDKQAGQESLSPEEVARAARVAQREANEKIESLKSDIQEKLFKEAPTELIAGDGKPIKTAQDVMQYTNPLTQELFTYEEAASWLLSASQELKDQAVVREKEVNRIAELNFNVADQADEIKGKYGELLAADPALREKLWKQYESEALVYDPGNPDIILNAKMSLKTFYENALEPRLEAFNAKKAEDSKVVEQQAQQQQADATKQQEEDDAKRQRELAEKSDIYQPSHTPELSGEDQEWAKAHEAVFGDRMQQFNK